MNLPATLRASAISNQRPGDSVAGFLGFDSDLEVMFLNRWKAVAGPEPHRQFLFCKGRRWRFDFAWPQADPVIAVEVEGGTLGKSRHTSRDGFRKDAEKYNTATLMGWVVFRLTPAMFEEWIPKLVKHVRRAGG